MTFSDQYLNTLQRIYDLSQKGEFNEIEADFSIPKMFGAWSSIFWALKYFGKFNGLTTDQLKNLVKALIKVHVNYSKTTNQYLCTNTIEWIAGIFKIKVMNEKERLYIDKWVKELFINPNTDYVYQN